MKILTPHGLKLKLSLSDAVTKTQSLVDDSERVLSVLRYNINAPDRVTHHASKDDIKDSERVDGRTEVTVDGVCLQLYRV